MNKKKIVVATLRICLGIGMVIVGFLLTPLFDLRPDIEFTEKMEAAWNLIQLIVGLLIGMLGTYITGVHELVMKLLEL